MRDDPLTAFISRSLREDVADVRSELIAKNATMELERIRFRQGDADRSLVLKRVPPDDALEVQLLPFLSRKTDRVPVVRSRGIPPPAVPAWPWVLIEDLADARSACHGESSAILRAKAAVERAVARDAPALGALGVPTITPIDLVERASERAAVDRPIDADARTAASELATLQPVLCHGDLVCANARLAERGVVLVEWRRAHIGCGLLDVVRLINDADVFADRKTPFAAYALYGELSGADIDQGLVRAAALVDRITRGVRKK